jgi:hypothetical protein
MSDAIVFAFLFSDALFLLFYFLTFLLCAPLSLPYACFSLNSFVYALAYIVNLVGGSFLMTMASSVV